MKKSFIMITVVLSMFFIVCYAENTESVNIVFNGAPVVFSNQQPEIVSDITYVPVREMFELFGASVSWNDDTETVTIEKDGRRVSFEMNSDSAAVTENGETVTHKFENSSYMKNDCNFVPLRFVSEVLGYEVSWEEAAKTVTITEDDWSAGWTLRASLPDIVLTITDDGLISRERKGVLTTVDYNKECGTNLSFIKLDTWNQNFVALTEDNTTGERGLIMSSMGTLWVTPDYTFSVSDIPIKGNEKFQVNDFIICGDQIYAGCNDGLIIVITTCSKCYKLKSVSDFDIISLYLENGNVCIKGRNDESLNIPLDRLRQTNITVDEALALAEDGAVLVDVRTEEEYSQRHYENSVNIPLDQIDKIEEYPIDTTLIFYCESGGRAQKVLEYAQTKGYMNVYNLGSVSLLLD